MITNFSTNVSTTLTSEEIEIGYDYVPLEVKDLRTYIIKLLSRNP